MDTLDLIRGANHLAEEIRRIMLQSRDEKHLAALRRAEDLAHDLAELLERSQAEWPADTRDAEVATSRSY